MASTPRYPSPTNAFLPEPTGMIISYARDTSKFPLNRYCQLVQSPAALFMYYTLDRDQPVRLVSDKEFDWQDGDDAPTGNANKSNFAAESDRCFRKAYPFRIGEEAAAAAEQLGGWSHIQVESQNCASQAMTARTVDVIGALETTGNYAASHVVTATVLGGGKWDVATVANPYIKLGILNAARTINLDSNGIVQTDDMRCVINPDAAVEMSQTGEILGYMQSSVFSRGNITGELTTNEMWGLPDHIGGVEIVVENSMRVTTRPVSAGTAGTRSLIKAKTSACIVSRPGGLDGAYGTQAYSTVQLYWYRYNLAVEARYHEWNKRHDGRVLREDKAVLAAPPTGFLITELVD